MDKLEKLISEIMAEAEADGEPVTREEAKEMAEMELSAKNNRSYEQSETKAQKKPKARKVDTIKKKILDSFRIVIEGMQLNNGEEKNVNIKNEVELSFPYCGDNYTIKLIKHRPPKK